jgi:hypothetical protein
MYVLREAKPGQAGSVVVERGEERFEVTVTFGTSRRTN